MSKYRGSVPTVVDARRRADELQAAGDRCEHLAFCRWAVQRWPADAALRLSFGDALSLAEPEAAVAEYRLAGNWAEPTDGWTLLGASRGLSYLFENDAFELCGRAGEVIDASHPAYPALLHLQGRLTAWAGDVDDAEKFLRGALALDQENSTFWGDLADLLVATGRRSEAEALLDVALSERYISVDFFDQTRAHLERRERADEGP